ncbi:MAG: hypothetical protein HQK60_18010 [Deltaproteobacteria bacterium]|nr:hypothetical protein [Deltaproteobacteria bacterium]
MNSDGNNSEDTKANISISQKFDAIMKQYETAVETRKLEITLFWTRSLFYWGFIASAFIAYAKLHNDSKIAIIVACFGLVCSVAWTLANRGSKFWQETWEMKVEQAEKSLIKSLEQAEKLLEKTPITHLFTQPEKVEPQKCCWIELCAWLRRWDCLLTCRHCLRSWCHSYFKRLDGCPLPNSLRLPKGFWLRSRQYSVSKLAMLLSDYAAFLWFSIIMWEFFRLFESSTDVGKFKPWLIACFVVLSILYTVFILFAGKSGSPQCSLTPCDNPPEPNGSVNQSTRSQSSPR